ncbi:NAD(P)H-dependent oxidoreductase [Actinomadura sp. 3N407]|uniref:NAD(P)H-dependent oxidoreductase n=1 Tax=Actinomadura sp. 3N407 TaxID=3457423 RepID=UPI003FCDDCA2
MTTATFDPEEPPQTGLSRVVLLGGSAAQPSHTQVLLEAAVSALVHAGAEPIHWDIGRTPFPPAGPGHESGQRLRDSVDAAHAVILVTPLYHNSYSGLIKNALDHLGEAHLRGKPVGLMSSSGRVASPQALDHLRVVVRALDGVAIPDQVIATRHDFTRMGSGLELTNPRLNDRISDFIRELLWYAERLGEGGRSAGPPSRTGDPEGRGEDASSVAHPVDGELSEAMNQAIAYIRAHYREGTLALEEVARHVCMSRYHFSRTFRVQTGRRFMDFVAMLRLSDARVMLTETDKQVSEICHAVGYNDLSHFERTFKRWFKVSPSQYRLRHPRGRASDRAPVLQR